MENLNNTNHIAHGGYFQWASPCHLDYSAVLVHSSDWFAYSIVITLITLNSHRISATSLNRLLPAIFNYCSILRGPHLDIYCSKLAYLILFQVNILTRYIFICGMTYIYESFYKVEHVQRKVHPLDIQNACVNEKHWNYWNICGIGPVSYKNFTFIL